MNKRLSDINKMYDELMKYIILEIKERKINNKLTNSVSKYYEKTGTITPKQFSLVMDFLMNDMKGM